MRRYRSLGKLMSRIMTGGARLLLAPLPAWPKAAAMGRFIESAAPIHVRMTAHGPIKFFCPGHNPVDRAFRLFDKEPDTVAWLDSMRPDDVLWDVGANVGTYTLYAALKGNAVCAFEPEASNFWILSRNLDLNGVHDRVKALNVALSSQTGLVTFVLAKVKSGAGKHQGVSSGAPSKMGRAVMAFSSTDLARTFALPRPTYLKIDVDGHELGVLRGIDLAEPGLRSLQVEVRDNGDAEEVCRLLEHHGFVLEGSFDALKQRAGKATNFRFDRRGSGVAAVPAPVAEDGRLES